MKWLWMMMKINWIWKLDTVEEEKEKNEKNEATKTENNYSNKGIWSDYKRWCQEF